MGRRILFLRPPVEAPGQSLAVELCVQCSELLQEPVIGRNVPVGAHSFDGVHQSHVLMDHQVSQNQGG